MFNRRQLEKEHVLVIPEISFASDAIGAAAGTGRSATTPWAEMDNVVFKGRLKDILVFGIMAFGGSSVSVAEQYELQPISRWRDTPNLTAGDIVTAISLDPADGEGIVVANDISFLESITNTYRLNPTASFRIVREEKADATNKAIFTGTLLQAIAYALQYDLVGDAPVYTLYEFSLMTAGGVAVGVSYDTLMGDNGPTELEAFQVTIANSILSVPAA